MARIYSLKAGSVLPDSVLTLAKEGGVKTASVEALGGVRSLKLAYFNHAKRTYEQHTFREFLEVASLVGNITLRDGKPFLHAHGTFGRRDMTAIAGHLVSAKVFPLLEVVMSPTSNRALRKFDDETGLNMIYRT